MRLQELIIEKVNNNIFQPGYSSNKSILGGKYHLIADVINVGNPSEPALKISAVDEDLDTVGAAVFSMKRGLLYLTKHLEAFNIQIRPEVRGQGIAKEIYKYVQELGNTVKPSPVQTKMGKDMWKGFKKQGIIK